MASYIDVDKKIEEINMRIESTTKLIENRPYDEEARLILREHKFCLKELKNAPTADVVEVVRCKDCVWFVPEHIKLSDGTTRPYTDEEKKMPCGVTSDIGINVGSYCLRKGYWKQNSIPVWFQENDFCSYGERGDT